MDGNSGPKRVISGGGEPVPRRTARNRCGDCVATGVVDNRSVAQTQATNACRIVRIYQKANGGSRCGLRGERQSERNISLTEGRTCPRRYDRGRVIFQRTGSCIPARAAVAANTCRGVVSFAPPFVRVNPLAQGVPIRDVAEILGHSDVRLTLARMHTSSKRAETVRLASWSSASNGVIERCGCQIGCQSHGSRARIGIRNR